MFDEWSASELDQLIAAGLDINERDEDGQTALKNAVDAANYDKVKALLSHDNIEVDPVDSQLWTPLHDACQLGPVEIVELLCDVGHANIEARNDEGFTPLQVAAFHGSADIICALLERKADASSLGNDNITALHRAAFNNHPEAAQALIRGGADCNFRGQRGITPLHAAAEEGDPSIVSMLLDAGADVNARRDDGVTPLGIAVYRGDEAIVRMLLQRGAVGCSMALLNRALSNCPAVALLLLDADHDTGLPMTFGGDHTTPEPPLLLMSALGGFAGDADRDEETALALASRLLHRGAGCNTPSPTTRATPLHVSAANGWPKLTKLLLKQPNIDVDARGGDQGLTPLWAAAGSGELQVIRSLLDAGAEVDAAAHDDGTTPLMRAAWVGMDEAAKLLVEAGASCRLQDKSGRNAIETANRAGQGSLAVFLARRAAEQSVDLSPLEDEASHGQCWEYPGKHFDSPLHAEPSHGPDTLRDQPPGKNEEQPTPVSGAWLAMEGLAEKEVPDPTGDRRPGWLRQRVLDERHRVMTSARPCEGKPLQEVYAERELPFL
jgi:cytohesin